MQLREGRAEDEDAVISVIRAAMDTYRTWCSGWTLPHDLEGRERERWRTDSPASQRVVACLEEGVVGVSVWSEAPVAVLSLLMVAPSAWETGVAVALHDLTVRDAAACSATTIRLTVPERNTRARRFYEKRGWQRTSSAPEIHPWLGMAMLEYTRELA